MTTSQLIGWWESRRIFFNFIVGVSGIISLLVITLVSFISEKVSAQFIEWPDPPLFLLFVIFIYATMANICYTFGWILELIAREVWGENAKYFGEITFTFGIIGSVLLTLIPGFLVALTFFITLLISGSP